MKPLPPTTVRIHLRLRELAQLFNSLDPSPFLDRDLDADAEEFIVSWAREQPLDHPFELNVHLAAIPPADRAAGTQEAVQHYFAMRAEIKQREFRQLLRRGRVSLVVGLLFLAGCLSAAHVVAKLLYDPISAIVREGLTIAGWVALWRPLEIYLYDWWPIRAERVLLERLARMHVKVILPPQ